VRKAVSTSVANQAGLAIVPADTTTNASSASAKGATMPTMPTARQPYRTSITVTSLIYEKVRSTQREFSYALDRNVTMEEIITAFINVATEHKADLKKEIYNK
jgi:hypothetical protein